MVEEWMAFSLTKKHCPINLETLDQFSREVAILLVTYGGHLSSRVVFLDILVNLDSLSHCVSWDELET